MQQIGESFFVSRIFCKRIFQVDEIHSTRAEINKLLSVQFVITPESFDDQFDNFLGDINRLTNKLSKLCVANVNIDLKITRKPSYDEVVG